MEEDDCSTNIREPDDVSARQTSSSISPRAKAGKSKVKRCSHAPHPPAEKR